MQVRRHDTGLELSLGGDAVQFDYLWLRDNCPSAFHPDTRERDFDLLSVPDGLVARDARIESDELVIEWAGDPVHVSRFTIGWLERRTNRARERAPTVATPWAAGFAPERFDAARLLDDDTTLRDWLEALTASGLTLVTGLADDADAGCRVAERIAFLRRTNFGTTFDVRTVARPNNQAYTSAGLALHTDLANQETPPGYQFLHAVLNDSAGGESRFVDGLRVAADLRAEAPDAFELLATVAIPFRFHDDDHDLQARRPVLRRDHTGRVVEISYNAHLADTFDLPPALVRPYYLAYRAFMRRLREPRYAVAFRLDAGSMIAFDNRRVLHGRDAFDPTSGSRHFRGCYVDRGDLESRLRRLTADDAGSRR